MCVSTRPHAHDALSNYKCSTGEVDVRHFFQLQVIVCTVHHLIDPSSRGFLLITQKKCRETPSIAMLFPW